MKRLLILALAMCIGATTIYAQTAKEIAKERKQVSKLSKSELNAKAGKAAAKEAKKLKKQGWSVSPGALPLEKQLDKSYNMQYEYSEGGAPRYIFSEGMSIGGNYDAAKMQALELAKINLAGQVQTEVVSLVESSVANSQMDKGDAASVVETVGASKNLISQSLGRIVPVVECYRLKSNNNTEVLVRVVYDSSKAVDAAKQVVRQELKEKSVKLHDQLDKVMGF